MFIPAESGRRGGYADPARVPLRNGLSETEELGMIATSQ